MDPETVLANCREQADTIIRILDKGNGSIAELEKIARRADSLAEGFKNLDEWIKRGGFLPKAWERKS